MSSDDAATFQHIVAPTLDDLERSVFPEDFCGAHGKFAVGFAVNGRHSDNESINVSHDELLGY